MTINPPKLLFELLEASLPVESVDTVANIGWTTTPTSEQLSTAAAVVAAHDPINQILVDFGLTVDELLTKAQTWRDFFYTNRNVDFSTMDTATQDLVIKRLMFVAIYVLDDFMAGYDDFYTDPP